MMDRTEQHLMFLRNIIHGAPVSSVRIAARLREIDKDLNSSRPAALRVPIKDADVYLELAKQFRRP